ncbi:glycosyltransferase [Catenuloplanes japonicus]|uniref:glycosyltransferase n=1 Tax=Catenuloplanes japonicus TaxID=33876 RepID=UPI001E4C66B5|nr:glycosyltransferase [Catenuloplanes japonicus]
MRYLPRHDVPVILVDNASSDGTADAVTEALPHVYVVRAHTDMGAAARNAGAELAGTPYVAFADDDSYWEAGSLGRAATLLDVHPHVALLTARVLVGPDGLGDPISTAMDAAPLGTPPNLPGPAVLGFLARAAVVRRDAFLAVGGFNPTLHAYGEALLAMDLAAAGWDLAYVPALTVRHLPPGRTRSPAIVRTGREQPATPGPQRPAHRAVTTSAADRGRGRPVRLACGRAGPRRSGGRGAAAPVGPAPPAPAPATGRGVRTHAGEHRPLRHEARWWRGQRRPLRTWRTSS